MNPSIKTLIKRIATVVVVTLACAALIDWLIPSHKSARQAQGFVESKMTVESSIVSSFEVRIQIGALVFELRSGRELLARPLR